MRRTTGIFLCFCLFAGFTINMFSGCKKSNDDNKIPINTGTVTDVDGNVYATVTIGTQTWMASNLKTTHFRNMKPVQGVTDSAQWVSLDIPGYCSYGNDASNAAVYGLLYNWYAVADTDSIAPAGWHVPSDAEWLILENYLGSSAGGAMKVTGDTYWELPNTGATNSSGFSALAAGDRSNSGMFHYLGQYGCWWSATESSADQAWEHVVKSNSATVTRMVWSKKLGISVRCVKDKNP